VGSNGGTVGGTVFRITPSGKLTTLYTFCSQSACTDGSVPLAGLVPASNGDLYGTTEFGGANDACYNIYGAELGCGTVFKITPSGKLTTLYSFCAQSECTDGSMPMAGLVQATNGDLYGTTWHGGLATNISNCFGYQPGCGTVFKIIPGGTLTTLYSFCPPGGIDCPGGQFTAAGLVLDTNGDFYGTTWGGGTVDSAGTVFSLSVGLGPFVKTLPISSKVGAAVKILGTNLTGAISVTFNGTAAVFTVVSKSEIATTVPAGATTGTVQVATPGGTLSSNVPFRVP
jgi:uncharacterized repeat protein (TIGR03803 family)